ncbi:hypothetical protein FB451DRAFT_1295277 [Mycena latifolia]|nr:hypothetical protein FB451DRAFT_1295277 [Mycena latifolia]
MQSQRGHIQSILDFRTPLPNPRRNDVQLPQELIDTIIDEFDLDTNNPNLFPDLEVLRSCALVSRAFVRPSQMKLFSTVDLCGTYGQSADEKSSLFSKLISARPHLRSYIKTLILSYRCARSNSVDRILSSLSLHPSLQYARRGDYLHPAFPILLRQTFLAVFSMASLRCLELRNHQFEDPQDLENILSNSLGLKELVLFSIRFASIPPLPSEIRPDPPRVLLESLEVFQMLNDHVDAVLASFTVVDVTHLRFITCDRYYRSLLHANAHSIQKLTRIESLLGDEYIQAPRNPLDEALPADTSLRRLIVRVRTLGAMTFMVRQLGNLARMKALKHVAITGPHRLPAWPSVDALLADLCTGLNAFHIGLDNYGEAGEDTHRSFLPALNATGILRILPSSKVEYF